MNRSVAILIKLWLARPIINRYDFLFNRQVAPSIYMISHLEKMLAKIISKHPNKTNFEFFFHVSVSFYCKLSNYIGLYVISKIDKHTRKERFC